MATKKPEEFVPGDVIKNVSTTSYSGSAVASTKDLKDGRTQVSFANFEIVEFFNGIEHEMRE